LPSPVNITPLKVPGIRSAPDLSVLVELVAACDDDWSDANPRRDIGRDFRVHGQTSRWLQLDTNRFRKDTTPMASCDYVGHNALGRRRPMLLVSCLVPVDLLASEQNERHPVTHPLRAFKSHHRPPTRINASAYVDVLMLGGRDGTATVLGKLVRRRRNHRRLRFPTQRPPNLARCCFLLALHQAIITRMHFLSLCRQRCRNAARRWSPNNSVHDWALRVATAG